MGRLIDAAKAALAAAIDDQNTRIPTDANWENLTSLQKIAEMSKINRLERAVNLAEKRETTFINARRAAFETLSATHQSDMSTLQTTWQQKEDAGYVVEDTLPA